MDGISDKMSEAQGAKDSGRLRNATLDIDDTGLLASVLPAVAKMQGSTPEALVAMVMVPIAAFTANQGAPTLKALDAVVSFIMDWKKPNGPIKGLGQAGQDREPRGSRQDRPAQRAGRPVWPQRRLCRYARRRGGGRQWADGFRRALRRIWRRRRQAAERRGGRDVAGRQHALGQVRRRRDL